MEVIKICVVIPSFEPNNNLLTLLENLRSYLCEREDFPLKTEIILVDDGSGLNYANFFKQAEDYYGCILLRHAVNLGKGRALKTAFNYYLNEFSDFDGVVTVDSDGQHIPEDIFRCINCFSDCSSQSSLILGCRNFDDNAVPVKSLVGNKLTRSVFRFLCGVSLSDTQTGLRVIPTELVKTMIVIPGERFEYETNMLIRCKQENIELREVPIQAIYVNNNNGTHFNSLVDSLKIYAVFLKYALSSLLSFGIDVGFFSLFNEFFRSLSSQYILYATILARIISSLCNYSINKSIVFGKPDKGFSIITMIKYYTLALFIMFASGFLTTFLFRYSPLNEIFSKMIVDTILFLTSYYVQQNWVFRQNKREGSR